MEQPLPGYGTTMEAGACRGSFNSTSSSTELSMAVTIANQAEVIIGILPYRQAPAPAPFFKGVIGRLLPRHEQPVLVVDFDGLPWGQAELFAQLGRQGQLAVFGYHGSHG